MKPTHLIPWIMIGLLVVGVVFVAFPPTKGQMHLGQEEFTDVGITLDARTEQVAVAWARAKKSPKFNSADGNVAMSLWYSELMRLGVPQHYAEPNLFRATVMIDNKDLQALRMYVQPHFTVEREMHKKDELDRAPRPLGPICMQM